VPRERVRQASGIRPCKGSRDASAGCTDPRTRGLSTDVTLFSPRFGFVCPTEPSLRACQGGLGTVRLRHTIEGLHRRTFPIASVTQSYDSVPMGGRVCSQSNLILV